MKWLYYAVLAYLVYSVWKIVRTVKQRLGGARAEPRLSGMMVKDEACETYLPKEQALREVIDGEEHFFCSQECRKKFLEARKQG